MIRKQKLIILFLAFLFQVVTYAQVGKITGRVVDRTTNEPLIGANVIVVGTSLGAATDIDGNFFILNVNPGTYTLKASYIGYKEQIIKNVRVSVNLTSQVDFSLVSEEFQTETIVVTATKPLVDKNITNSTSLVKSEDIENLPVRGVNAIVAQQAGVVSQNGNLHVRGSRGDETAYYIDGVLVNNPVFGGAQTDVINNAIEEIQVQSGGYSAEFGGANGGIISTQTRTGREKYEFSFETITDNFKKVGEKYLGGYSYGYSEYVFTLGGPILPSYKKLRFYLAASNQFRRSPAKFYQGIDYDKLYDPSVGTEVSVHIPDGYLLGYLNNRYQVLGNLLWDLNPISFRLNANFKRTERRNGIDMNNKDEYHARNSTGLHEDYTISSSLKFTHVLGNKAFYDIIFNYFSDFYVDMDPFLKHNITAYGDSILNAQLGRPFRTEGQLPAELRAFGWTFMPSDAPIQGYRKQRTERFGGKFSILYQLGDHHELKAGFEYDRYTIRRYSIGRNSTINIAANNLAIADGNVLDKYLFLDNYGYNVYGKKTDEGGLRAKHPEFGAIFVQDKMEFSDLVLQIGFRFDYIFTDSKNFDNPNNIKFDKNGEIDQSHLVDVPATKQISPRLGFSFPVTDRTVFHAQYGKFIQQSRLRDIYLGYNVLADFIKGGLAVSQPVGFGLKPEKTTSYEIGFRQQLGDNFAFDITGFYKDIKDQVQERSIFAESGAQHGLYYAWVNGDFSTVKGFELKLDLRRTSRLAMQASYTFSDARGTGSNPSSAFRAIWQSPTSDPFFPLQVAPLDFNQTHRGFINIDYRFSDNDGPEILGSKIFSNFGMNFTLGFTSGFNYTRWEGFGNSRVPLEPLNASQTPWTFQIDTKIDKSFTLGGLRFNIYAWVINLLNTKNVIDVFNTSGDATDDGWLASPEGRSKYEGYRLNYGQEVADLYAKVYREMSYNADHFGPPRQINVGIKLIY